MSHGYWTFWHYMRPVDDFGNEVECRSDVVMRKLYYMAPAYCANNYGWHL